jgi:hypothetical protein
MRRRLFALAALVIALGACASEAEQTFDDATTTTTTTTTTADGSRTTTTTEATTTEAQRPEVEVPDDWQLIEGDGVLMGVPESWTALDLEEGDLEELLDEIIEANPDLDSALTGQVRGLIGRGAVLFAVDFGLTEYADNANVIRVPGRAPSDPAMLESTATAGIGMLGGEVIDTRTVSLPAGDALRVEYEVPFGMPDGTSVDIHGVQHYILADASYVLTVSQATPDAGDLADQIADTFRAW